MQVLRLPVVVARHRDLLGSFVWRDLKSRYEGSLLGRLWPILNPLILFSLFYFVFAVIMAVKLDSRGMVSPELQAKIEAMGPSLMGLYIISGVLPWTAFSEALIRCTGVVLENGNLVKKIAFPSELLPIYTVVVSLIYFLIGLAIFLIVTLLFFGGPPASIWLLLFAIPLQALAMVGIGLFLGAFNIFVRDTSQMIGLILQLIFFTTPIVYMAELLDKALPNGSWVLKLNPMFHLMELYHCALVPYYDDIFYEGKIPWSSVGVVAGVSVISVVIGYSFYLATKGRFADEL